MIEFNLRVVFKIIATLFLFVLISCSSTKQIASSNNSRLSDKKEMEFTHYLVEANKLKTLGYLKESIVAYNKCLSIKENSGAVNYELANLYIFKKNYTKALEYSERASKFDKQNIWYQLVYANLLLQSGEYKKTVVVLEDLSTQYPNNFEILITLADVYATNKKDYSNALEYYKKAESVSGFSDELFFKQEKIYLALGKKDKVLENLDNLVEANPKNSRYIGIYAETLMNFGKHAEAQKVYEKLFEIDSNNGIAHLSYGEFLLKNGDTGKATQEFKTGLRNENLDIVPKIDLIISLSRHYNKEYDAEIMHKLIDIIIEVHPKSIEGNKIKAELFLKQENIKEAKNQLVRIIEVKKDNYLIWEQLILIDFELHDYQDMFTHSMEAIESFPNYGKFLLYNGLACQNLNKHKEAIDILEIGQDIVVGNNDLEAELLSVLAESYYRDKQLDKAFVAFDELLVLKPNNIVALNNYSYYLTLENTNLEKANKMATRAVELEPKSGTFLDTYAWVLYKQKRFADAKVQIELAISYSDNVSTALYEHYGDILYKNNRKYEAKKQWEIAIEKGGNKEKLNILKQK